MINYGQFQFASPPRMGCTWFMHAAGMASFTPDAVGKTTAHTPGDIGVNGMCVVMARNPYTWLSSYYHAMEGGAINVSVVDIPFARIAKEATSFGAFVAKYLDTIPGAIGKMHDAYKANTVIRLEDLPWAATEFFQIVKPHANYEAILKAPPINVNSTVCPKVPMLRKAVMQAEKDYCERYEYV